MEFSAATNEWLRSPAPAIGTIGVFGSSEGICFMTGVNFGGSIALMQFTLTKAP